MKKVGWLVVNEFLNGKKFQEIYQWLVDASLRKNIELRVLTNAQILVEYDCCGVHLKACNNGVKKEELLPEFVLFWDKDIPLAKAIESQGVPMLNCADAVAACDDKSLTHRLLSPYNIPMPQTFSIPMTFSGIGYNNMDFLKKIEDSLQYPFVLKECFGSFGAQVYLVHNREEAEEKLQQLAGKPMIAQEYIKTSEGRDIRIHMVGGQPVTAMVRYNDKDFRANITNGGSMRLYTPTEEQIALARKVCEILKLDFAGVDILFGEDEKPILCEVNSNAHFKNIYDCTGVNVADYIMDYVVQQVYGDKE